MNTLQTLPDDLHNTTFNIILTSPNQSHIFRYSCHNLHPLRPFSCRLPDALNIPWFDNSNNIWHVTILLIYSSASSSFLTIRSSSHVFSNTLNCVLPFNGTFSKGQKTGEHRANRKQGALMTENAKKKNKDRDAVEAVGCVTKGIGYLTLI